jgi:GWxTD domain-containing protein
MFQVASFDTSADIHLSWEILNRNENEEADSQKFQGSLCIQESGTPMITEKMGRVTFTILKDTKHDRVVFVPIPLERLEAGRYKFTITMIQDTLKSIKEFSFNVIWPRKPRSLFNLKLAIDALKHIATEEEIDQITTLNSVKSQKAFHEFWRKQNPDTSSAYNPRMAEYYRRVDETIKRYSNKDEMDGYRTDRGRIYILFGSPSITNRLLKPNTAPAEIWTYEKLRQQFTFIDRQRNGNFILEKEEKY